MQMIPYSLLDLSPVLEGCDASVAFRNTLDLAQHAEKWGYHRYWLAEHHNLPSVASAATAVVIGYVAGGTKTIRVGAGGIMLPNHAPLVIAEQFGTLESLYPGRIDLALGRAPGSDQATARALRRYFESADTFPDDLLELMSYFRAPKTGQRVTAVPGAGLHVPIFLLGSSDFSARLAAEFGLPFGFASHFAPDYLDVALELYRREFKPSDDLKKPYAIVGAGVYAADSDKEAQRLFSSAQLQTLNLIRGNPTKLQPPNDKMDNIWSPQERAAIDHRTKYAAVGSPKNVQQKLQEILQQTRADEIIVTAQIFDHAARLRSFEIAAEVFADIKSA
jgi:luciferase family oxidoreductase group 1